jgi:predicted SAM-dependent methyltransferase
VRRFGHRTSVALNAPSAAVEAYLARTPVARLNVGCGGALLDGWLNADRDPPAGAVFLDVTRRFPLADAAFAYVLSEHVIEHVPLEVGRAMLCECARVLAPGGRIRVSTPDLQRLVTLAQGDDSEAARRYVAWAVGAFWPGGRGSAGALVLNHAVRAWGHRFLYDAETLTAALEDAGFGEVRRFAYRVSDDPVFASVEGRGIDGVGIEMRTFETIALEGTRF